MKKLTLILAFLVLSNTSHAALEQLDNQALQDVAGQGGADISLELRLNHNTSAGFVCANNELEYCRIAFAINNRYADGSYRDSTGQARDKDGVSIANVGLKQWLVFKGVQGTINIQKIGLDGADLTYLNDTGTSTITKPAIQFSFDDSKPILFRNVGYQSLAIETDNVANEGAGNDPGYLVTGTYGGTGFDAGREVGFTGLNINGNLAIAGTIKVFSCDAGHPRC